MSETSSIPGTVEITDADSQVLQTLLRDYLSSTSDLETLNKSVKEKRDTRKLATESLKQFLVDKEINKVDLADGSVELETTTRKKPLNRDLIKDQIAGFKRDHPELSQSMNEVNDEALAQYIYDQRPAETKYEIKVKVKRQRRQRISTTATDDSD